ncbi:MAG: ATP-dependent DNA helicase RecG [Candidatus Omnitrophica bacterium]|nr:ATP-dependent DNA helicase RecG [Candidatus Omnitrophota bacterium]
MTQTQEKSARFIKGIGPKRFEALNRLGIQTIRDLCYFFPRRHEDRTSFLPIAEVDRGKDVTIRCQVLALGVRPLKQVSLFEMVVGDQTGTLQAVWFNQPYLKNQFKVGDQIILSGKAERYQNRLQLSSPDYERVQEGEAEGIHAGRITPIYPLSEGLAQRSLRAAMKEVVDHYVSGEIKEFLPEEIRRKHGLMELAVSIKAMHFPEELPLLEAARKRIIFDEFFIFELILLSKIRSIQLKERARPFKNDLDLLSKFSDVLPFQLTQDQAKAINEIFSDVTKEVPMNRLLQGEVGSGKTMVAAFFLYLAVQSGLQGALLVPTEILAEQHFQNLGSLLNSLGVSVALLTGSTEEENRHQILLGIQEGTICILIGTHALLQEDVQFKSLGFVVIDEQHRFGVRQRAKLMLRSPRPHLLVMTATPIPRTLGLTLYGDLDISTLRELPKGRKKIKTYWVDRNKEKEILETIRLRVQEANEQAYILFPLVDELDRFNHQPNLHEQYTVSAATKEYERLRKGIFRNVSIGLVHGRLNKKERDQVMQGFYKGGIKILVATSVIEVGVDNPHVTFMVIENAERFGLSQLHQMRGRIGRGEKEAVCFLFGHPTTEEAGKRLEILTKTDDGFVIAEEDLILRGPGDFFGTKQSGFPFFQSADLIRDAEMLTVARNEAKHLLDQDPSLVASDHQRLVEEMNYRRVKFQTQ